MDIEKLIRELKEESEKKMSVATSLRTKAPETSFDFFKMAELLKNAAEELNKQVPQKMEIEGGGRSWWIVCPECHGAIDASDQYCRHCGQAVEK